MEEAAERIAKGGIPPAWPCPLAFPWRSGSMPDDPNMHSHIHTESTTAVSHPRIIEQLLVGRALRACLECQQGRGALQLRQVLQQVREKMQAQGLAVQCSRVQSGARSMLQTSC